MDMRVCCIIEKGKLNYLKVLFMKKFLYTICLALVCCLLQGCSSEQTAILDEGVEL